jgi:HEAT repeat protein
VTERIDMRQSGSLESIIEALHHEDPNVRWEAARALGVIRDPRAVEPLIAALGDRDPDVRRKAALSLAKIRDLRAVDPLLACSVKDENQVVRWAAAWGLGKFPDRKIA